MGFCSVTFGTSKHIKNRSKSIAIAVITFEIVLKVGTNMQ
jgi:hypothetical protein